MIGLNLSYDEILMSCILPQFNTINRGNCHILFTQLKRGYIVCPSLIDKCLEESLEDTLVIAFYTRDIRGGMGERKLFRDILRSILIKRPDISEAIIPLIPEYGRWDDVWSFMKISDEVTGAINSTVLEQFRADQESEVPSLLAKWLPREGSKNGHLSIHFANLLFSITPVNYRLRVYRKTLSYMNTLLKTTEVNMCGGQWASIVPKDIPKKLMKRNKNAFLNTRGNIDRVQCAEKFSEYIQYDIKVSYKLPEHKYTILDSPRYSAVRKALNGIKV